MAELRLGTVACFKDDERTATSVEVRLFGTAEAEPPVVARLSLEGEGIPVERLCQNGKLGLISTYFLVQDMGIKLYPVAPDWKVNWEKARLDAAIDYLMPEDPDPCAKKVLESYRGCSSITRALTLFLPSRECHGVSKGWLWLYQRLPGLKANGLITDEEIALFKGEKE